MTERALVTASIAAENTFSNPLEVFEAYNFALSGTWTATVHLQHSFDGGTTWLDDGSTFTANGVWIGDVVRRGQQVRLGVKTGNYTNGTVVCRLSRGGVE